MHHVSLIIEFLRGRPKVVFWTVALMQGVLWTLIPSLFYSAPPNGVPLVLAIGHEFMLGSYRGPPLAFWLGEIAFRLGGLPGVYALSQICIVTMLWAVFALGRSIAGTRHAVLAVLLMAGITAFTVPSPDFGPAVLAAPLWALALLHYWRAVGEAQRGAWFLLALDLGLLLLANYIGIVLIALMIVFTLGSARGRRELSYSEPWIGLALFAVVIFPHAAWAYDALAFLQAEFAAAMPPAGRFTPVVWLCLALVATHIGLALLAVLASGFRRQRNERAPEIDRPPVEAFARLYVYFFAAAPAFLAILLTFAGEREWLPPAPLGALAPLVVLSGLALILAAGDRVQIYRERTVSSAWIGLLFAQPAMVVISLAVMPWLFSADAGIAQPAKAEGQFFAESYMRRTLQPLKYISGDERIAPLIALTAPNRPRVFFAWAPQRSPWASVDDVAKEGAVLVWPAENSIAPPETLKTQFPAMVPELPHAFARTVQGRLPPVRLGWSVLRPQASP
ncbi:MAG TPA: glycosyltransferase family 39 protein [Pseudolabrys sp.]|nr:glycosyltransferase family 39 protein [Pseudolabrys sp.]